MFRHLLRDFSTKRNDSIPKGMIFNIMKILDNIVIDSQINVGDIIVKNILNTGVDIVSIKSMDRLI
ncbi:MAG: DUF1667 domain-containing protein [Romboutsia sp.]